MFAQEKLKKSVSMICTKLVIEIQLIIKKFAVGSVEYVADLQVQGGSNKKHAGKKIDKRLREMVKQPEDQFDEQGYHISFDPLREGNCQFSSTCCVLQNLVFSAHQKH